jgi:hypothetical protein
VPSPVSLALAGFLFCCRSEMNWQCRIIEAKTYFSVFAGLVFMGQPGFYWIMARCNSLTGAPHSIST